MLTLLMVIYFSLPLWAADNEDTISTIGMSTLDLTPNQTVIMLEVSGIGKSEVQLEYEINQNVDLLMERLNDEDDIEENSIKKLKQIIKTNNDKYNRKKFKITIPLKIQINNNYTDNQLIDILRNVLQIINNTDPSNKHATYNRSIEITYNIRELYYNFQDYQQQQKRLFKETLTDSKEKLKLIAKILNLKDLRIHKVQEIKSSRLKNYKQSINLNHLQSPQPAKFKEKIKVTYYLY
ncbi:hypothetical protein [Orenia marismortui]|uniref:hypothetical protein n=1 Tax=Orenia marismortui TaxID=46469 RepID=UPI00037AD6DB|nr:hypothetical protein [Orenia marismortui]